MPPTVFRRACAAFKRAAGPPAGEGQCPVRSPALSHRWAQKSFSRKRFCKLINKKLACYDTMWGGEPRHDVPNPYRKSYTLRISWVTSNIHRRRHRLSVAKGTVLLIPTIRLLEKLGPVLLPEARNVVLIIHMHVGSALIHPVKPGATGWTVGIATGS